MVPPLLRTYLLNIRTLVVLMTVFSAVAITTRPANRSDSDHWSVRIRTVGAHTAYLELKERIREHPIETQHAEAHVFGKALYATVGIPGITTCDDSFDYGCLHQFIGEEIIGHGLGVLPSNNDYCDTVKNPEECLHGLGHGILAYFGYGEDTLGKALDQCALIHTKTRNTCFSGLFMEYNLRSMFGADASVRSASQGTFSPCDRIRSEYMPYCYRSEPTWWRRSLLKNESTDIAFEKIGALCRRLPEGTLQRECFIGTGREADPASDFNVTYATELCKHASRSSAETEWCAQGVLLAAHAGKK